VTSKKISWYRSMCDKIDNENKLWDMALKVADGGRVDPSLRKEKGGKGKNRPKKNREWEELVAEAKIEKQKRLEKERKFNKSRKEKEQ